MRCVLALTAAMLIGAMAAKAAPEADLAAQILACSVLKDGAAQLACYNKIAAGLRAGQNVPPANDNANNAKIETQAGPAEAARDKRAAPTSAASDFAGDTVPFHKEANAAPVSMTAHIAAFSYNFYRRFTVVLDNGQVWRQDDDDDATPQLAKGQSVTITRGFLDAFHLKIAGEWGNFAVRRIK